MHSVCFAHAMVDYQVAAGDTLLGLYEKERLGLLQYADDEFKEESYWETLDADLRYWTRSLRPVQVYIRCALVELTH